MAHLVAAPDKFKGTATASDVADAMCRAASACGWTSLAAPMADGGEGILDVFRGTLRSTTVTGPLGQPVSAEWRLDGSTAVIEMARASGLVLAGGADRNDPMEATTAGTGELIAAAIGAGARRVIVGVGGSATTDGGLGAVRALGSGARLHGVEVLVACDVTTPFLDAADVFAPQKGANPAEVALLRRRLERLAQDFLTEFGVDVRHISGSGAAGGLAGGLAAIGATLLPGFELVAETLELADSIEAADLVITGEGCLDAQSFEGKVVGGVTRIATRMGVPTLAVVGDSAPDLQGLPEMFEYVALTARYGRERSLAEPLHLIEEVVGQALRRR